jgi:hypothetical protein
MRACRLLLIAAVLAAHPAMAEPGTVSDLSSQDVRRAPTRITVRPAGKLVRECEFHLAREVRANGTYVIPRQRCWWTRQR